MNKIETSKWKEFAFKDLFSHIVQGRRLKSADHIAGDLPFVMAGMINEGVSGYISNDVRRFPAGAITIDIFGNTFYRNYEFGASDDVGVFWNDENKFSADAGLFIASVISKQLLGKFDFANKLRASQTHDMHLFLPILDSGEIAFDFMESVIKSERAKMQKLVDIYKAVRAKNLAGGGGEASRFQI